MAPRMIERFVEDALERPSGVILVTGPTGSGKTSTLYSCVNHINRPETSIITAEDPVEYVIEGIGQCSLNPAIDLTYEETLRHIVRQDPDVIVIGEIRDTFSAETAIQAALTGHKVLTTFHTEDSIGGLLRLLNMEIEAFLVSSTVVSVLAQRLLRRVCERCASEVEASASELRRLGYLAKEFQGAGLRRGRGCETCRYTGYRGRIAVFELLVLDEPVRDAVLHRGTAYEIRRVSRESSGLLSLLEDGIVKAARGVTTLEEVLRTLPRLDAPRPVNELRRLLGG
jgi:type IV pilus assembly protein PilB